MSADNSLIPIWERDILNFKGIKSTFIIEHNIADIYPTFMRSGEADEEVEFFGINRAIYNLFQDGYTKDYYDFLVCDPLFSFSDPLGGGYTSDIVSYFQGLVENRNSDKEALNGNTLRESYVEDRPIRCSEIIREAMTQARTNSDNEAKSIAVIVNYASRFLSGPDGMSVNDVTFFTNLLYASENAVRANRYINTLILIVDKFNDVPAWFYLNNPNVRQVSIPYPDRFVREKYIEKCFRDLNTQEYIKTKNTLVDFTDGLKLLEISEIRRLHQNTGNPISDIIETASVYKYGFKDNPWLQIRDSLPDNMEEEIEKRVKGQEQAIGRIVNIIKRSVTGLSGIQHSAQSSKPRGIFFLSGPTGTGKTEAVKAVTEMIFKDEKALLRFDMSEFSEEHSDQKLFGAPPGYVGYDSGGQLTNAVRNRPFSVLLFDEIEKAHPSIMDKFLQILEDGRMTDGQGNTVYFGETMIFFTSNLGICRDEVDPFTKKVLHREYLVQPGEPYEQIEKKVTDAVQEAFKPEVMNRIGDNIIVFNYISEESSKAIAGAMLKRINANIKTQMGIDVNISSEAENYVYGLCWQDEPRKFGGRGIGNVIEAQYVNPMSAFFYDQKCISGDTVNISVANDQLTFVKE